jgi:hypothetical protein
MPARSADALFQIAEGTLQNVDLIAREMSVRVDGSVMAFDLPPDCTVLLNQERVKLRLLQPTDRVRVTFWDTNGRHQARLVEVSS